MYVLLLVAVIILVIACLRCRKRARTLVVDDGVNADYVIAIDTEFTGSNVAHCQVVQIGIALVDVKRSVVCDVVVIGPIGLDEGRRWNTDCRKFWLSQPDMTDLMNAVDRQEPENITTKQAADKFVATLAEWRNDRAPDTKWAFATDTVIADASHVNSLLCQHGHASLQYQFGKYRDAVYVDCLRDRLIGAGYTKEGLKKHVLAPKNRGAHDAGNDAYYIGECLLFYRKLLLFNLLFGAMS